MEQAGAGEDSAAVLQFPLAGPTPGPGVRALLDHEAVGRHALLRRLQTLLLSLLLLHCRPQVQEVDHHQIGLHQHIAGHSETEGCQRAQNHRNCPQIV